MLPRVVAPGCEQSIWTVSPFSSEDLPDVGQLSESNLIPNARYVVELAPYAQYVSTVLHRRCSTVGYCTTS